jgi:hypothetical protein
VFRGHATWLSPAFFYPVKGALAYSQALFIQALPYSLFRALGFDPYISFEITLILFAFFGYAFTVYLLRRLGVTRTFAIVGGLLFAFSNLFRIWAMAP